LLFVQKCVSESDKSNFVHIQDLSISQTVPIQKSSCVVDSGTSYSKSVSSSPIQVTRLFTFSAQPGTINLEKKTHKKPKIQRSQKHNITQTHRKS